MEKKIIGKWQYVCWKVNTHTGWEKLENYSHDRFIWDLQLIKC